MDLSSNMHLLLVSFFLILLIILVKYVHTFIWIPYRIQNHFKKQGISGPGYRLITGNSAEIRRMYVEAASKPVLGFDHDIVCRAMPLYDRWSGMYGRTFLYWFGSVPRLAISDPDMIKEVLTGGSFEKIPFNPSANLLFGQGLVGLDPNVKKLVQLNVCALQRVWDTLEKLCTKKNTARLQLLENELAMLKQGEIDADDKISEAVYGWSQQPSVEELENLLSNQEALAKQMAKKFESELFSSQREANKKNTSAWIRLKKKIQVQRKVAIHKVTSWPGTQKSPFEILYGEKPNVNYFGKGWRCMDQEQIICYFQDVVFDEVSSLCFAKARGKNIALMMIKTTLSLYSEINLQAPSNDETENESKAEYSRPEDGEQQAVRRSTRETRQPDLSKIMRYNLSLHSDLMFLYWALSAEEPESYEEAKDCLKWGRAMQEEIEALDKNETWELVPNQKIVSQSLVDGLSVEEKIRWDDDRFKLI
ncbi:uncharacterized protein LOC116118330 [Pistacia vera]|uniref:uncharacterized protein LOC116118330 n=1 Tax=Pistacia vera TaxID=55513 RepID=UPI0012630420|nr:uncharacterized protein LOC116118330 [Pistacia vera]